MVQKSYPCPQCGTDVTYIVNPCPNCNLKLNWTQLPPIPYIPPTGKPQQQSGQLQGEAQKKEVSPPKILTSFNYPRREKSTPHLENWMVFLIILTLFALAVFYYVKSKESSYKPTTVSNNSTSNTGLGASGSDTGGGIFDKLPIPKTISPPPIQKKPSMGAPSHIK